MRERRTDVRLLRAKLLLHAQHPKRARRLDRRDADHPIGDIECPRVLPWRDGGERADGEPGSKPSGDLCRRKNCGVRWSIHEVAARRAARSSTDAAAVEPARPSDKALTTTGEQLVSFNEKRPTFLEYHLEGREVHDRRIRFDLAKVRIDGGVQGKIWPEAELEVTTGAATRPCVERISRIGIRTEGQIRRNVREELEPPGAWNASDTLEAPELRCVARRGDGDEHPLRAFALVGDNARELEPPRLLRRRVEPELRKRDAQLGGPALGVNPRATAPHRIELELSAAILAVLRMVEVAAHTAGREREAVCRAPVEVRVERDHEHLGIAVAIPTRDRGSDRAGVTAPKACAHVQRIVVVQQLHLRGDAGRCSLNRDLLHEVGHCRCVNPDGIVERPVDARRRSGDADGARGLGGRALRDGDER